MFQPSAPAATAAPAPTTDVATVRADAHLRSADEVARALGVDLARGLDSAEVDARRQQHGANRLPEAPPRPLWLRIADQFRDFMIGVLLAAALLAGLIGEWTDTLVIVLIVLLNAAIGFWQGWRADQALQALQRLAAARASVRRDGGQVCMVDADALLPGDVVLLEAGNLVPADLRLAEVAQLRVDESALTGESVTVEKLSAALDIGAAPGTAPSAHANLALGDQLNMAFKGTLVSHGRAVGLVVATGAATALGQVATLLHGAEDRSTPLQQRLARFGKRLALVALAVCALVFVLGLLRGEALLPMALVAVSLAVAAIPEALPAVVTVLLALGARRLVTVNALVRRLPSVETLGAVSVICSDKTGTLTQNRMQWRCHQAAPGIADTTLWTALVLCNDARAAAADRPAAPAPGAAGPDSAAAPAWRGDPTETALLQAAHDAGIDVGALHAGRPRLGEWPFDAERKRMTTLHADAERGWCAYVKGAPESLLPRCVGAGVDDALAQAQRWAAQGLRVLAVAQRRGGGAAADAPDALQSLSADAFERGLTLLGLVGLIDPPRPEARAAVAQCRRAGVRPVMITGDHPATALAIALDLGLVDAPADPPRAGVPTAAAVLTGAELAALDDAALAAAVQRVSVYARTDPAQKIRIVRALQAQGLFVAMTGDGVNDAPALRAADIGVAMGRGGTDVAREASSLVLLDDNFATIVGAVREGRRIFDNIRKFIRYALTGNLGEVSVLFVAPLLGLPLPLLPIHILWVNLVTDGLPGLALAAEPAERGVMARPPRPAAESVLADGLWQRALAGGALIGALCLGLQAWALHGHSAWIDPTHAQTLVFTLLTLAQMALLLGIRSEHESLFSQGLGSNRPLLGAVALTVVLQAATTYLPALQPLFHTHALSAPEAALCGALAGLVFVAAEADKAWRRHGRRRHRH